MRQYTTLDNLDSQGKHTSELMRKQRMSKMGPHFSIKVHYTKNQKSKKASKSRNKEHDRRRNRSPTPIRADEQEEQLSPNYRPVTPTPMHEVYEYAGDENWYPDDNNDATSINNYPIELVTCTTTDNIQSDLFVIGALQNIGNSCYMNAVLYALRFTPNFTHFIHHLMQNLGIIADEFSLDRESMCEYQNATVTLSRDIDNWDEILLQDSLDYRVIFALHETFAQLTRSEVNTMESAIRPRNFQRAVYRVDDIFVPGTQQDSHEFLLSVLNSIRDCSNEMMVYAQNKPELFFGWNGDPMKLLNLSYFQENFTGLRLTSKRCFSCDTDVHISEEIIDVLITLSNESELNENFIQESCVIDEKLNGMDKIRCDDCSGYFEARKRIVYPRLPRFMIVQLSRFDSNMNKIETATPIPFTMACFCVDCVNSIRNEGNSMHQYHLYGIILHVGSTLRSGHYISYVKFSIENPACPDEICCQIQPDNVNRNDGNGGTNHIEWIICDDDEITPISKMCLETKLKEEANFKTPYVLFYARDDTLAT